MTTTLTHFAYWIDMWNANGENIVEHSCERAVVDDRRRVGVPGGAKRKAPVLKHGA